MSHVNITDEARVMSLLHCFVIVMIELISVFVAL